MRKIKMLFFGVLALFAFGAAAATNASAETITFNPGGNITATARRTLILDPSRLQVRCDLTFNANLTNTSIIAPLNTLVQIGSVTGATAGACDGNITLALLNVTRWLVFARVNTGGTITLLIKPAAFEVTLSRSPLLTCLYQGDVKADLINSGSQLSFDSAQPIPFIRGTGGALCPRPGTLGGTINLSPSQTVTIR